MEFRKASGVAKGGLTTGIIGTSLGALALLGTGGNALGNILGGGGINRNAGLGQAYMDGIMMQALLGQNAGCGCGCGQTVCSCESDHLVTRNDATKDAEIARLQTEIALRDANTYVDKKNLEMYQYIDGRLRGIEGQIAQQAVLNQATQDKFQLVQQEQECCCNSVKQMICTERDERRCADNAIVNYANATFYPKLVADITTGTTTTAQTLFNPIPTPTCGCGC